MQRASLLLQNVEYVIEAHFEMTEKANASDNPGKFKDIIMRRCEEASVSTCPILDAGNFQPILLCVRKSIFILPTR